MCLSVRCGGNQPAIVTICISYLNRMNNFGERYMAFFTPLVTGQYSMFITANDQGELLISDQPNITNVTRYVCNISHIPTLLATPYC